MRHALHPIDLISNKSQSLHILLSIKRAKTSSNVATLQKKHSKTALHFCRRTKLTSRYVHESGFYQYVQMAIEQCQQVCSGRPHIRVHDRRQEKVLKNYHFSLFPKCRHLTSNVTSQITLSLCYPCYRKISGPLLAVPKTEEVPVALPLLQASWENCLKPPTEKSFSTTFTTTCTLTSGFPQGLGHATLPGGYPSVSKRISLQKFGSCTSSTVPMHR